MKIRKVFTGKVVSNSRNVYNSEIGQEITEGSLIAYDGIRKSSLSLDWHSPLFRVEGLYPVGTKFTLTLEEVEAE